MADIKTPWTTKDEIIVFAIVGVLGAVIGVNALTIYRKVKASAA